MTENPLIKKDTTILLNNRYKSPSTSLLFFHFEPHLFDSVESKLKNTFYTIDTIENKNIYIFDHFFSEEESQHLLEVSKKTSFSRHCYASHDSRTQGENPASSMNNKEKWEFFSKPPLALKVIFKLLNTLSHKMDADISTQPWDLCDQNICTSAFATNRIEKISKETMLNGRHSDYNTEEGIPFAIPILYSKEKTYHPSSFINGDFGKPWLVTIMLYAANENFVPEHGMGTVFCKNNGDIFSRADCLHSRFILFEGDLIHSIEESKISQMADSWRISYVFKLLFNPKKENQSMKTNFYELIHSYNKNI